MARHNREIALVMHNLLAFPRSNSWDKNQKINSYGLKLGKP